MVWAVSLLTTKLIPRSLTGWRESISSILSLPRLGTAFAARIETVALPLDRYRHRCASTHFGENQLAPSSIGISPLTTTHPPIFQHRSVRTSTWCYPSFILVMVRSPGFGSIRSDFTPYSDSLSLGLRGILTLPLPISRRLILQQARGQL